MKRKFLSAALACAVVSLASPVYAGSVLPPGITVGLPVGAPLPEGIYFIDTAGFGHRTDKVGDNGINLPVFAWATPISFYNTRLQFIFAQPFGWTTGTPKNVVYANSTLFAGQLAHDFGNGFGASYLAGYRAAMPYVAAFTQDSFEQRAAVSFTGGGYDLTANLANGIFGENARYPDWLNLDLTATKKFGKFEVGLIAYGSTDISSPTSAYRRQGQFAVGALGGYDFGPFKVQVYASRDVAERNYGGYDTRGWFRLILPLYKAPQVANAAPLQARD
ncbi:MAG: transporter [Methylovirgula sp.]|jgi:hypothetical protein